MGRTIFAIFDDFPTAQRVASTLERDGFDASRMSVLVPKSPVPGLSSRLKPGAQPEKTGPGDSGALQDVAVPGVGLVAAAGPLMGVCSESNTDPGGW